MWCRLCPYFHVSLTRHFRRTSLVLLLTGLINIILCTYYAYIDANQKNYTEDDWQSCVVYGEAALAKLGYNTRFSIAAAGEFKGDKGCERTSCERTESIKPPPMSRRHDLFPHLPPLTLARFARARFARARFARAAAGQQTLIFSLLAAVTLYRALSHPEWLVSTLAFVFYAFIGCFCYFSFAPAIPFPTSLNANIFTLMLFVKPSMYDGVTSPDPSVCDVAYNFNLFFMVVNYLMISMVAVLFFIGCLAESRRRR